MSEKQSKRLTRIINLENRVDALARNLEEIKAMITGMIKTEKENYEKIMEVMKK